MVLDISSRRTGMRIRVLFPVVALGLLLSENQLLLGQVMWKATNGPGQGRIWSLAVDDQERVFALTDSGLFRSTDKGDTWVVLNVATRGDYYTGAVAVAPSGEVFVNAVENGLWRSSDRGESWAQRASGLDAALDFVFHPSGTIFFKSWGAVYRSNDDGLTWESVGNFLDTLWGKSLGIDAAGNIFTTAVSWGPSEEPATYCVRSTDQGQSWSLWGGSLQFLSPTCCVAYDMVIGATGRIFIASDEMGLYRSGNEGGAWERLSFPFHIHNSAFALDSSKHIFFASPLDCGVIETADELNTWMSVNAGLEDSTAMSLAASPFGYLYAGTEGGIVYRTVNPTTGVNGTHPFAPRTYVLNQNYPNPFNPSTTITYELPKSSVVRLSVYDLLGREVSVLVNERRNAGSHEVNFDAAGLSSGTYIYRLQAGDFVQTRRLVLLK